MKFHFVWLLAGVFLTADAKAADLKESSLTPYLSNQITQTRISDHFLQQMQNCNAYQESKTVDNLGIPTKYEYEVLGWKENKCECKFSTTTDMENFSNHCFFGKKELQDYTLALMSLSKKGDEALTDFSDVDNMTAMTIIYNEDICKMEHKGNDQTAEFRKHL